MKYPWEPKVDDYAGFYANIRDDEFITWLRYYFIKKNAPARLINRLDEIDVDLGGAYEEGFKDGEEAKKAELSVGSNDRAVT